MKLSIFIILSLFADLTRAQMNSVEDLLNQKTIDVEKIETSNVKSKVAWIGFDFGGSKIEHQEQISFLNKRQITKVAYTYSGFKEVRSFKQRRLDSLRFEALLDVFPNLLGDPLIKWQTIRQTLLTSKSEAEKLFHGFVIYSKSIQKPDHLSHLDSNEHELENDLLMPREEIGIIKEWIGKPCSPEIISLPSIEFETGRYLPVMKWKRNKGITYESQGIWKKRTKQIDYIEVFDTIPCTYERHQEVLISDSTVYATLKRKEWNNAVVVQDVTGSMHGYLTQTFMWQREYGLKSGINRYVFFNDGNDHPDGLLGATGGQSKITSTVSAEIEETAYKVMELGNGGKEPENDIESLYYAMRIFPKAQHFILIADNTSNVSDLELLPKLTKSVHVIICGSSISQNVHPHYLKIAIQTGGTVHTLDHDIENLQSLKEGGKIRIGKRLYQKVNGNLKLIRY